MKKILSLLALMAIFQSCRQSKDCPALDAKYMALISYSQDSIIRFINTSGAEIDFRVTNTVASSSYTTDCLRGEIGYDCDKTPCSASALFNSVSDSSRNGHNSFGINVNFKSYGINNNSAQVSVNLMDYHQGIDISTKYHLPGDTIFDHLTLGTHSYDTVTTVSADTAGSDQKIWRIYFSNKDGVIAFADRQTNSIFYLK